jgi:hypothetical protein
MDATLGRRAYDQMASCNSLDGCHISGAAGLFFVPGNEAEEVVNVDSTERPGMKRVLPGDPWSSYLYLKVLGDGGIEGGRMPLNGSAYDPAMVALFYAWIEAGAPPP